MERALAVIRNPILPPSLGGGTAPSVESGGKGVGLLIGNIIGGLFIFGFIIAFFYLLTGAFFWITSGGDKNGLESARNRIIHSLVGLLILASAWAMFSLVGKFFGIDLRNLPIPSIE